MVASIVGNRKAIEASLDRPNVAEDIDDQISELAARFNALPKTTRSTYKEQKVGVDSKMANITENKNNNNNNNKKKKKL